MGLRDLKTKQSLVGINNPISDMENTLGTQWADFRNNSFGGGQEPQLDPDTLADTLAEKSLTMPYTYQHGPDYETYRFGKATTVSQVEQDLDGVAPSSGKYLDRDHTKS